jgi:hypothetical protein
MKGPKRWLLAGLAATLLVAVGGHTGCKRSVSKKGRSDTPMKPQPLHPLTPATVAGWQAADTGREFSGKGVFEALNGGAEIYLDYGFRRVLVREYKKARRPRLTLHFFEMRSAPDAFGMFTHEREGVDAAVGEDSDYAGGLLRFWKGRHFVSILAPSETPEVKRAILALGRHVASHLRASGKRPTMLAWLPVKGRRVGSERYLHTHAALMHHLRLGSANVLGLDRRTAVAMASYGKVSDELRALVVRYPNAERAGLAAKGAARWRPPPSRSPGGTTSTARFTTQRCGRILGVVWGAGPAAARTALLKRVASRIPEC